MENDGFDSRSHSAFGDVVLNNGHIFVGPQTKPSHLAVQLLVKVSVSTATEVFSPFIGTRKKVLQDLWKMR